VAVRAEPIDRLRDDVRLLGELVGAVLREQGGLELYVDVEFVRQAAIELRSSNASDAELLSWAEGQSTRRLLQLVRAFSTYFHLINLEQRTAHERLIRNCFIDYDREMALVAERRKGSTGEAEILGVGRMSKVFGTNEAEVAVIVSDAWQGRGLGKELVRRLVSVGADEKLDRVIADILPENTEIQRLCEKLGFTLKHSLEDELVRAEFAL